MTCQNISCSINLKRDPDADRIAFSSSFTSSNSSNFIEITPGTKSMMDTFLIY